MAGRAAVVVLMGAAAGGAAPSLAADTRTRGSQARRPIHTEVRIDALIHAPALQVGPILGVERRSTTELRLVYIQRQGLTSHAAARSPRRRARRLGAARVGLAIPALTEELPRDGDHLSCHALRGKVAGPARGHRFATRSRRIR